ncbi:hypothetical protein EAF00_008948 [Botryotinia globosa]|nr:hypothetical protein EAF00_008948 [Botryotinia globosa]
MAGHYKATPEMFAKRASNSDGFKSLPLSPKAFNEPQFSGFMRPSQIRGTFYRIMPEPQFPNYLPGDPWFNGDGNHRVTFLSADLSKSKLGLGDEIYNGLLQNATQIIHNAWPVNFHINLSSYHPHLLGVVNLAKFASETSRSPSLLYISSVSAVSSFTSVDSSVSRIPEAIIHDALASEPMGYGESKYLSERILDYASKKFNSKLTLHVLVRYPVLSKGHLAEERKKEGKKWETGRAQMQSEKLRDLGKIEDTWLEKWIKTWVNNNSNQSHFNVKLPDPSYETSADELDTIIRKE